MPPGKVTTPVTPDEPRAAHDALAPDAPSGPAGPDSERRCILTGDRLAPEALVRLALAPDGAVVPDIAGRLPGRGGWVRLDRALIAHGVQSGRIRGGLARAFRQSPAGMTVAPHLDQWIADLLKDRALHRLGLENRGGCIITGADSVQELVRAGRARLVLHAADAAEDGRRRLARPGLAVMVIPASRNEIGLALGRDSVVHAAASDPRAAARVTKDVGRWLRYLGADHTLGGSEDNKALPAAAASEGCD